MNHEALKTVCLKRNFLWWMSLHFYSICFAFILKWNWIISALLAYAFTSVNVSRRRAFKSIARIPAAWAHLTKAIDWIIKTQNVSIKMFKLDYCFLRLFRVSTAKTSKQRWCLSMYSLRSCCSSSAYSHVNATRNKVVI